MLAQKLYIDLVLLSRRINSQLDFQELPFGDQLEPFPAEFDRLPSILQACAPKGLSPVVQVNPKVVRQSQNSGMVNPLKFRAKAVWYGVF